MKCMRSLLAIRDGERGDPGRAAGQGRGGAGVRHARAHADGVTQHGASRLASAHSRLGGTVILSSSRTAEMDTAEGEFPARPVPGDTGAGAGSRRSPGPGSPHPPVSRSSGRRACSRRCGTHVVAVSGYRHRPVTKALRHSDRTVLGAAAAMADIVACAGVARTGFFLAQTAWCSRMSAPCPASPHAHRYPGRSPPLACPMLPGVLVSDVPPGQAVSVTRL